MLVALLSALSGADRLRFAAIVPGKSGNARGTLMEFMYATMRRVISVFIISMAKILVFSEVGQDQILLVLFDRHIIQAR